LPLWLQQYMDYTATDAGLLVAPVGILALILSPFVGQRVGRTDPRIHASVGFFIFGIALYLRTLYNSQADFGFLVIPIIVQGAATAFFFVPLVSLILSGLPAQRIPAASGLSNFARITAGSFGTSIATSAWEHRSIMHHARLAEYVTNASVAAPSYFQTLQGGGFSLGQAAAMINRQIDAEAHLLAANDVFWGSSVLFFALIGVIWLARPARGGPGAAAPAH